MLGKGDRWYLRVNVQPQNVAYSGFLHKASILLWHTQPPSSSCTQMLIPPQLLCLSGNLSVLSACPFLLWHNVVCNRWPPTTHTLTVCSLYMWCNIGVFWGSVWGWGGRASGHCIFFFTPPSVSVRLSDSSKRPCSFFTPYPRSGQYERSPGERRTKGHTCDTLRPFGSGSG